LPGATISSGLDFCWRPVAREKEAREYPRRALRCRVTLFDSTATKEAGAVIPAECSNFSNGGLYAVVPMGYGVAIGRRYTFELAIDEPGPEPDHRQVFSRQGEITRAELLFGKNGYADHVGIGVRLFGPCSGLVPVLMTA